MLATNNHLTTGLADNFTFLSLVANPTDDDTTIPKPIRARIGHQIYLIKLWRKQMMNETNEIDKRLEQMSIQTDDDWFVDGSDENSTVELFKALKHVSKAPWLK